PRDEVFLQLHRRRPVAAARRQHLYVRTAMRATAAAEWVAPRDRVMNPLPAERSMSEAMKKREPIKVLLVEDRIDDAELLLAEMRRGGLPVVSLRVENAPAYTDALRQFAPQLILSDYTLPDFDGPLALRIARRERPDTPFIFVSGTIGEERAIDALQQGAVDYVLKDNRARLVPAIER